MLIEGIFNYCSLFLLVSSQAYKIIECKPLLSKAGTYGVCVCVCCVYVHMCLGKHAPVYNCL